MHARGFCTWGALLLLCMGATVAADGAVTRFMPGDNGEIPAWLINGPHGAADKALESRGPDALDLSGADWRLVTTAESSISPASAEESSGEVGQTFYGYTRIFTPYAQRGYLFLVSTGPAVVWTGTARGESEWDERYRQHVTTLRVAYGKGSTAVLVRVTGRKGAPVFSLLAGSLVGGKAQFLRGLLAEVPVAIDLAQRRALLDERVALTLEPGLVRPGPMDLRLRWRRGAPVPLAPLRGRVALLEGTREVAGVELPEGLTPPKLRRGLKWQVEVESAAGEGPWQLRADLEVDGTERASLSRPCYPASALRTMVANAKENLETGEAAAGKAFPRARLDLLRLEELLGAGGGGDDRLGDVRAAMEKLELSLTAYVAGTDPLAQRRGRVTGAYVSRVDGSVQPYRFFIPSAPPAAAGYPLIVLYHGYVPYYRRTDWMDIPTELAASLEAEGMALLLPFGRSNTDFLSVGETDLFEALADLDARYPIDRNRLYLAGYSMGGSGVWTTLTHYPGRFAAARVWSGRTDYYYWHGLKRGSLPPYIEFLIRSDNPVDLAENLRNVPLYVRHPRGDSLVKSGHSEQMGALLLEIGHDEATLRVELPEDLTHWDYSAELVKAESWRWCKQFALDPRPRELEIATFTPKYGQRQWVRIEEIRDWGKRAYLSVEATAPGTVTVLGQQNVAALGIDPKGMPVWRTAAEGAGAVGIELPEPWEAKPLPPRGGWLRFAVHRTGEPAAGGVGLRKTPALCGPVKEAFNDAFLLVRGTGGSEQARARIDANVERFRREWLAFAKGEARCKADREIGTAEASHFHLICFGSPATNAVLASLAKDLPFHLADDAYGVGEVRIDRKGEELGFLACYPNPRAPERYLVVLDGLYYGDHLPRNHKWDLVPDYIVFGRAAGPRDTNQAHLAGFFDSSWQPVEALRYRPSGSADGP